MYSKMRKWQVAPKTFAGTEVNPEELRAAKYGQKSVTKSRRASQSGGYMSGGDQNNAAGNMTSISKFGNSPSGQMLSERRWNSPTNQSVNTRNDRFINN